MKMSMYSRFFAETMVKMLFVPPAIYWYQPTVYMLCTSQIKSTTVIIGIIIFLER
jgi:hypothetical protein